jgi:hypothetical protein
MLPLLLKSPIDPFLRATTHLPNILNNWTNNMKHTETSLPPKFEKKTKPFPAFLKPEFSLRAILNRT